jgi:hypothetical protein
MTALMQLAPNSGLVPRTLRSTKSAFTRVFDALW